MKYFLWCLLLIFNITIIVPYETLEGPPSTGPCPPVDISLLPPSPPSLASQGHSCSAVCPRPILLQVLARAAPFYQFTGHFFFSFCKPFYLRFIYIQKNAQIINVERNDFLWTKWTHLCNPHPSQSIECYQHLRSFLLCHFPTVISSKVTTNLSLPAFELHMNRITQCISLRVQILSFIAFVRIICVLHVEVVVLFLLLYSTSFIHLLYSGRLTFGFYCVNIMDNAVVNIWIPVL